MRKIFVATWAFAIALTTYAHLGETASQCDARYSGNDISSGNAKYSTYIDRDTGIIGHLGYLRDSVKINAYFYKGKCFKLEIEGVPSSGVESVLDANAEGSKWTRHQIDSSKYVRADGLAQATVKGGCIQIERTDVKPESQDEKRRTQAGMGVH